MIPTVSRVVELADTIVKSIVDDVNSVNVTGSFVDKGIMLEVKVGQGDVGKIIGKEGRIASALRTLIKAAGARDGQRVMVNVFNKPTDL